MTKGQRRLSQVALNVAVALCGIFFLVPFAWMVSASFKTTQEIFSYPPSLIPNAFSLENYQRLFSNWPFPNWYGNSLVVAILTTVMVLFFSSLAGFAFAKYRFRGQSACSVSDCRTPGIRPIRSATLSPPTFAVRCG